MHFSILGPLQVHDDGRIMTPKAHKLRVLLATLLVYSNVVLSVDELIDELWQDRPPPTAPQALRVYISQLRKLLEECGSRGNVGLFHEPPGYYISVENGMLDVAEFNRYWGSARAAHENGELCTALQHYRAASRLWRSTPLVDLRAGLLLQSATSRLEESWMAVQESRISLELRLRRNRGMIIAQLRELCVQHPFNERLPALLMVALYQSGRNGEALEVYRRVRQCLAEELGIEPGEDLRRVHKMVLDTALDLAELIDSWTA
jgi:DNA-binding SARP family transcriptional activator